MAKWRKAFPVDLADESFVRRREFARFLALVSTGFTAGIGYLWFRKKPLEGAPGSNGKSKLAVNLGPAEALRPGQSRLFTFRDQDDRCILLRTADGELKAYRQTCTHLGCAVRYKEGQLECPCHNGYFECGRGLPIQGPPTRALSGIALETHADGSLWAVGDLPKPVGFREG